MGQGAGGLVLLNAAGWRLDTGGAAGRAAG